MNIKHLMPSMAFLTLLSFQPCSAALQAPLPEFQSRQQLAGTKKQFAQSEVPSASASEGTFYTGKPFDAQRDGYLFQYRNYDPELNRWASLDPSGFPDGPNAAKYACVPTVQLDPTGCFSISVTNSATYNASSGGHHENSSDITQVDGLTSWMKTLLQSQYSGWTFHNLGSDLTVNISTYTANADSSGGGLSIAASLASGSAAAAHQYRWIQGIDTNDPKGSNPPNPNQVIDPTPNDDSLPFYETNAELAMEGQGVFSDSPYRFWPGDPDSKVSAGSITRWKAYCYLVDYNSSTSTVNVLGGFKYGFTLE
jgi:RHS repeat-associated protein